MILITGGNGLIGKRLSVRLIAEGKTVLISTRNTDRIKDKIPGARYFEWNGRTVITDRNLLCQITAVVHLMGAGVADKRWNEEYKKEILRSRTEPLKNLIASFKDAGHFPETIVSSSATGYYGNSDKAIDENASKGKGFLADVCEAWENECRRFGEYGCHTVSVRTGIVLDTGGGAFPKLILPFKLYAGSIPGTGKQWFSWIHHEDLVRIYEEALEGKLSGPVNAVAPRPLTMLQLTKEISGAMNRPYIGNVPEWLLRIILGESAIEITKSQNIIPGKLNQTGFQFSYPDIASALRSLLHKH